MEERTKDPGVAIGLAWTPVGGEVLFIEASRMAGTGSLTLTGQLGDVMKESARAALSWLRTHAREYGIDPDFFKNAEMHVHVPSGAIPKDGPSAGVTMAAAMASELTGRPVRGDIAMTGEITLVGPGAAGRRHQGEGSGGAARRHSRGHPAEAERQEHQRRSDAGAAQGPDRPSGVDGARRASRMRGRRSSPRRNSPASGTRPHSRSRRPGTSPISSSHSRAAAASGDSPGSRLPAGSSHKIAPDAVPVLPDQDDAPVVLYRNQHDAGDVTHRRDFVLGSVREAGVLDFDREDASLETPI